MSYREMTSFIAFEFCAANRIEPPVDATIADNIEVRTPSPE